MDVCSYLSVLSLYSCGDTLNDCLNTREKYFAVEKPVRSAMVAIDSLFVGCS